ncbi:MAG: MCE family protein [Solirubrobacterales bacterium]|nr:MCE family protein [Solirubrobacterales bacterium]
MKRAVLILLGLAAVAALAIAAVGAGSDGDTYRVRAIFDNAGFVIAGEDVKVAGVKVGVVESLDVTREAKAAVVLRIDDPGYQDFRSDARCIVRPQSLIGEKFVECEPTQKRAVGAEGAPALEEIERGPGEGQRLLPVQNTSKSVDLDLINNIMRLPYRQRFSIILNELGTGLAGRGEDLREVIRRADPALREVDDVLEILASQNETLTRLAKDSDEAIAPLAGERKSVTSFIEQSGEVAAATAERRTELEADLERLPGFLRELTPTMARLGEFADEATPVFSDLGASAPQINQFITELGPFSRAATPALKTLGEATKVGLPALQTARPVVRDLGTFASRVRPVGASLEGLLTSFRRNSGIERLMDFLFYSASAINGYDAFGHYLRAALLVNTCSNYVTVPLSGCTGNFRAPEEEESEIASAGPADEVLERTAKVLAGAAPKDVGTGELKPEASPAPQEKDPVSTPTPEREREPPTETAIAGLLDYLLGEEGE